MTDTSRSDTIIGIDFGTSNSCIAVWQFHRSEIVANNLGSRLTPSVVYPDGDNTLVGQAAKQMAAKEPERTIFRPKRFIGRSFDDPVVQEMKPLLPYNIINHHGLPFIEINQRVTSDDETTTSSSTAVIEYKKHIYSAIDISSYIFSNLLYFSIGIFIILNKLSYIPNV